MATIVTRSVKGSPLTWDEMDDNLLNLKYGSYTSVKDSAYGAVGDGITDDTVAIQAALDSGFSIITGAGLTYKCNNKLTLRSNLKLQDITLDFSNLTAVEPGYNYRTCILAQGTGIVDTSVLAANAVMGAYTATVSSGEGTKFVAGDYVLLTAEDVYLTITASTIKRAEIKQVQKVVGDVITFREALYEDYTTANTAKLNKLSMLSNIVLDNVNVIGTNTENHFNVGIRSVYVDNFVVRNSSINNCDLESIHICNTINYNVSNNNINGVRYTGVGSNFYGVAIWNNAQWGVIHGNIGQELRHLVVSSSSGYFYGQPYFTTITSNVMQNAQAGDNNASWAFENHGFGRFQVWANNTADSCYAGINIRTQDQLVTGNSFQNCRYTGINCSATGLILKNVTFSNNLITKATTDLNTGVYGILFNQDVTQVRENILITGNTIYGVELTGVQDFGMRIFAGSGSAKNCVISNNLFVKESGYEATDYGIYLEQAGWTIRGNTFRNYERAVSILPGADNTTICGNDFAVTTVSSTHAQIVAAANTAVIKENVFRGVYRGINVTGTDNHAYNNTEIGCSITSVDTGTSTIKVQPAF